MSADPKTPNEGEYLAIESLSEIVLVLDARLTLLTHTLDRHHEIFIAHGWASPQNLVSWNAKERKA